MIIRVWGLINGYQALSLFQQGDKWYFKPPVESGTYICEFWAEDDFGNIGYNAAILTVVDGSIKCIRVLSERYHSLMLADRWRVEPDPRGFSSSINVVRVCSEVAPRRYHSRPKPLNCPDNMQTA